MESQVQCYCPKCQPQCLRIWSFQYNSPVRLRIPRDGTPVLISGFWRTDEGWRRGSTEYRWDGRILSVECFTVEVDCDGKHYFEWRGECDTTVPGWLSQGFGSDGYPIPIMREVDTLTRDMTAEAAGY